MTTDTVGGVWSFSLQLAEGLLCAGASVALVSLGRLPSEEQKRSCTALLATHGGGFDYRALDVPLEWMEDNDGAYRLAAPALLSISKEFKPDLLHSNQFCFGALPTSVPKLITAHSDVLSWAKSCRDRVLEDTSWLRRYRKLVQDGLSAASAVAAPTHWMLQSLCDTYRVPHTCSVIANGCSIPERTSGIVELQAVTAGRLWDEGKGISLLGDVISPMPFLVAGENGFEGGCTPRLNFGRCECLGPVEHSDLLDLFSRSAIYICPSRYEPFGLAPLEAAMCGCAVLARDIPSLREVWEDAALFFRDAAALSLLLEGLYDDAESLQQLREKSRTRAVEFSLKRMTLAYLDLYQQLTETGVSGTHAA